MPFVLRTSRLTLRDFTPDDYEPLAAYQRDAQYQRYYPMPPDGEPGTRELLDRFLGWQQEEPRSRFQLGIVLSSGELIGTAGLRRRTPQSRVGDLGYELAPSCWGQGYATEAARALVEFGFTELALHRIHAHCVAENGPSARVLERIGMRREGVFREHEFFRERWWDVHWYGMLAAEWAAAASPASDGGEVAPLTASELAASLTVADLQASLSWYRDVLGFSEDRRFEREGRLRSVALRAGGVRILLNQDDGAKGADRAKGEGFSLMITTSQDVDGIAGRIQRSGGTLDSAPEDTPWGRRAFRARDPDGFRFAISSEG